MTSFSAGDIGGVYCHLSRMAPRLGTRTVRKDKLGKALSERRKALELTQDTVALRMNEVLGDSVITGRMVGRWERSGKIPQLRNRNALATALELDAWEDLLVETDDSIDRKIRDAELPLDARERIEAIVDTLIEQERKRGPEG